MKIPRLKFVSLLCALLFLSLLSLGAVGCSDDDDPENDSDPDAGDTEDAPVEDACDPVTDQELCDDHPDRCGEVSLEDNCGDDRNVDCGTCGDGEECDDGTCVDAGCEGDDDCPGDELCDTASGDCVECLNAEDCDEEFCNTDRGICAECLSNDDCEGEDEVCNESAGTCGACLSDDDCDFGLICTADGCERCQETGDCGSGQACCGADELDGQGGLCCPNLTHSCCFVESEEREMCIHPDDPEECA